MISPRSQDLDQAPLGDEPRAGSKASGVDAPFASNVVERVQVHDDGTRRRNGLLKPLAFGVRRCERRLATLEARRHGVPGRPVPFMPRPAVLPPLPPMPRPARRLRAGLGNRAAA